MIVKLKSVSDIDTSSFLISKRTVRFGDSDAAGVIHFHNLFRWAHESWEESLEKYGINLLEIFPIGKENNHSLSVALPIIHCKADFRKEVKTGDQLTIEIHPEKINESCFQVKTRFIYEKDCVAISVIRHLAINSATRKRCPLPITIDRWLESSSVNIGPKPI